MLPPRTRNAHGYGEPEPHDRGQRRQDHGARNSVRRRETEDRKLAVADDPAARNIVLANNGCGGPAIVFAQMRTRGTEWTAQPAALDDRPGVALTGLLSPASADAQSGIEPKGARLFLDAETLWLTRAEWWSEHPERGGVLLYEIEFLRPRLNQPLALEECDRVFSYRPDV